jgi:hypothetical protein
MAGQTGDDKVYCIYSLRHGAAEGVQEGIYAVYEVRRSNVEELRFVNSLLSMAEKSFDAKSLRRMEGAAQFNDYLEKWRREIAPLCEKHFALLGRPVGYCMAEGKRYRDGTIIEKDELAGLKPVAVGKEKERA